MRAAPRPILPALHAARLSALCCSRSRRPTAADAGSYLTPGPGKLVFVLDNSYSLFNDKDIEVAVMLPGGQPAEPAAAASAAVAPAPALSPVAAASGTTIVYWEGFSGRAEAPILLLEDAGVPYTLNRDVKDFLYKGGNQGRPCFACPVLVDDGFELAQVRRDRILLHTLNAFSLLGLIFGISGADHGDHGVARAKARLHLGRPARSVRVPASGLHRGGYMVGGVCGEESKR